MRRLLLSALALAVFGAGLQTTYAFAQDEDDAASRRRRESEFGDRQAPLPSLRNAGPCPFVKVLYDAARYIELAGGREASEAVGYTGEIQGVSASCRYMNAEPIRVEVDMLFSLGRGPQARGDQKTYRYWVAVTERNAAVLAKEYFDLPVTFPAGQDRVDVNERLSEINIPRARDTLSGANFEVLIGFEVTPEMAAFNREGKRFRVDAGTVATQ